MVRLSSRFGLLAVLLLAGGCGSTEDAATESPERKPAGPVVAPAEDGDGQEQPVVETKSEGPTFADYREEIRGLRRRGRPDWIRVGAAVKKAAELAQTDAERVELESWRAALEAGGAGAEAYEAAVALVNTRDLARYAEARELLRSVPKGTDLYPDAQAYLEWLQADSLVREASAAFDRGELKETFAKLAAALEIQVLGPDARASVEIRRRGWSAQARACREGVAHMRAGRVDEARKSFQEVVEGSQARRAVHRLAVASLGALDGKGEVPSDLSTVGERLLAFAEADFPEDSEEAASDPQPKPAPKDPEPAPKDPEPDPDEPEKKKEQDDWKDDFEEWGEDDWDEGSADSKSGGGDWSDSWEDDDWGDAKPEAPTPPSPPPPPPPPPLSAPATIVGTVRNPDGRAVPGADAEIGFASYVTDATGSFRLTIRKGGPLELLISKPGYRPTRVTVAALTARETREVGAVLAPGGGIKGRFVDAEGRAVKAAGTLWHSEPGSDWSSGFELEASETFVWEDQRVDQADLRFEIPGREEVSFKGVQAGTHDLVVTLRRVARLVAVVRLPSGEPAQGKVSYIVWHGNGGSGTELDLKPDGSISFELQPSTPPATRVTLRYPGHKDVNVPVADMERGEQREVAVDLVPRRRRR